ncbi:MAG: glutamate--cysteine ligase [Bacteriovoracaceae bacterium]
MKGAQGTYGMGIMVVSSGKEIIEMNRKARNKMNAGKNNIVFTSVLLQESVDTILKYQDNPAEITVYLVGGKVVGGFMRVNPLKGVDENLNSKGMVFQRLCLNEIREDDDRRCKEMIYSAIARLANLAAGLEIEEVTKNK